MSEENAAPEADETLDLEPELEPAPEADEEAELEEEAPEGGVLRDHERKPAADVREIEALRAGEARITREQLAEIRLRRAQADLETLLAACERLLDELEG